MTETLAKTQMLVFGILGAPLHTNHWALKLGVRRIWQRMEKISIFRRNGCGYHPQFTFEFFHISMVTLGLKQKRPHF